MASNPDNEQVVRDFCAAFPRLDIDEILGFFAEGATYHNIPMEPAVGEDAIRGVLEMFIPTSQSVEFEMLALASEGDVVFTERIDRFVMGDNTVELPVAGVFEVRDGKIAAWRDYFDLQTFMTQAAGQA
jgi:limonene-1,2-epoxide hydrolase